MTITAKSVIHRVVVDSLDDPTSVKWPISEIVRYFNAGQRAVLLFRPDVKSVTFSHTCTAGVRQTIPATYSKVLEVPRNTNGPALRQVLRKTLDRTIPGWTVMTGVTTIVHFDFDPREPRVVLVYPPAAVGAAIDVMASAYPTDITEPSDGLTWNDVTGNMDLPDLFDQPLHDFICAMAWGKDSEYAGNQQKAVGYATSFANFLGIEFKSLLAMMPYLMRDQPSAGPAAGAAA